MSWTGPDLWLELDPDDTELALMTREEVWAIWNHRWDVFGSRTPTDMLPDRWEAIHESDRRKQAFENGEQLALFGMLYRCAQTGMRIPKWAAKAFTEGHDAVQRREKGSWDDAFGRPLPKGTHLSSEARRIQVKIAMGRKLGEAWASVNYEGEYGKLPGVPIDDAFFDSLGAEFGVSRTVAKEIYYEIKHRAIKILSFRKSDQTSGNTDE